MVPAEGRRKPGELDIHSSPKAASVIYRLKVIGIAPVRLKLEPGKMHAFFLHLDGHVLTPRRIRMPSRRSRKVTVRLKRLKTKISQAEAGETGIAVTCRREGVFRVYYNGRDSGFNCPVTLKSGVGRQSIGLYLPHKDRIVYRRIRARYKKHVRMNWKQ